MANTGYTGVMDNKQLSMQEEDQEEFSAARFLFISGRLCLDFVHTGGEQERQIFEEWHAPTDLAAWFASSPLQAEDIEVRSEDLETAYALREALWASALAMVQGKEPEAGDLAVINTVARQPDLAPQLAAGESGPRWAGPLTASAALSTVARDAVDLFSSEQAGRIRQCANPQCLLFFVDTSRPGKRRWCSMQRCGNRPKTARYRSLHRSPKEGSYPAPSER